MKLENKRFCIDLYFGACDATGLYNSLCTTTIRKLQRDIREKADTDIELILFSSLATRMRASIQQSLEKKRWHMTNRQDRKKTMKLKNLNDNIRSDPEASMYWSLNSNLTSSIWSSICSSIYLSITSNLGKSLTQHLLSSIKTSVEERAQQWKRTLWNLEVSV